MSLVSIVMPVYNCEKYIGEAIESLLAQSYTDWELNAVDDCSTDNSAEIIKSFAKKDARIRYFRLDRNSGAAAARNKGIELAQGQYIAFLDSDDIFLNTKLEKSLTFMREHNAAVMCTDYEHIKENGERTGRIIHCKKKCDYKSCLRTNPIGTSTLIYDCSKLGKVYMPPAAKREDFAMWLLMLRTKVEYIYGLQEVLTLYRLNEGSVSSNKFKLIKYQYRLFRDFENFSVLRAAYHTAMWCVIKVLHIK